MTPPQRQRTVESGHRPDSPSTMRCALGAVHGSSVAGTHGCGTRTPMAAAVAEATCGLLGQMQLPNGWMLAKGTKSRTVAMGITPPTWRIEVDVPNWQRQ